MLLYPFSFILVNIRTCCPFKLHSLQRLSQRLNVLCHTKDIFMITNVDCAADQLSRFGVCPGDDKILAAHHVPLESCGYQSVDVLTHRHKDFTCQVTAFLAAMQLIFEVDSRGAILCEELGKLQHCRESTMPAKALSHIIRVPK